MPWRQLTGIYRIVHIASNKTYIGSSVSIAKRLAMHRRELQSGTHVNRHLRFAWKKYGQDAFAFELLVLCKREDLAVREQEFIDVYRDHGMFLYNVQPAAASRSGFIYRATEETKQRLRASMIGKNVGKVRSLEARLAQSLALKGRPHSPEHNAKVGLAHKGKPKLSLRGVSLSPERRAKLSAAHMGKTYSNEQCRKNAAAMRGVKLPARTEEHRRKLSIAKRRYDAINGPRKLSAEHKAKISATLKGRIFTDEHRRNLSFANNRFFRAKSLKSITSA